MTENYLQSFILNKIFFFSLSKCINKEDNEEKIIIQCLEKSNLKLYEITINLIEFWSLNNILKIFETINDIYNNFLTLFKSNELEISIETNTININFNICDIFGEKNKITIKLLQKDNILIKFKQDIKQIKEDINYVKEQNYFIKNEIYQKLNDLKNEHSNLLKKHNLLQSSILYSKNSFNDGTPKMDPYKINKSDNIINNNIDIKKDKEKKLKGDELNSNEINNIKVKNENLDKYENDDNFNSLSLNLKFQQKLVENKNKQRKDGKNNSTIFTAFKSRNNINYLIYEKNKTTIIFYDITNRKKNKIRNAHEDSINVVKHFIDQRFNKEMDIIVTVSQNSCKISDINILNNFLNINLRIKGEISSICIFPNKNNMFLYISSKLKSEPIKYYDSYNKEAKIEDSDGETNYITFLTIFYML